eukprot:gb/GEZN01013590.1/.p1 GENE.gb/GEZN01013590.1/~~gb/GEZN01013590.1/.p1  ORF type:complete len:334 (+),score=25.60 gb/GEZN01013590.1/:43-1002(+)
MAAAESVKLVIKYSLDVGMTAGVYTDTLVVTHDAPLAGSTQTWSIQLTLNEDPVFSYTLDTLNMVQSVTTSAPLSNVAFQITFKNNGRAQVNFSQVYFQGYDPCPASVCWLPNPVLPLGPGLSRVFTFNSPVPNGSSYGNITFVHDAVLQPHPLRIAFAVHRGDPILVVNSSWTVKLRKGSTNSLEHLEIRNSGIGPMDLVFTLATNLGYLGWAQLGSASHRIQPHDSYQLPVTFDSTKVAGDTNNPTVSLIISGIMSGSVVITPALVEPHLFINAFPNLTAEVKGTAASAGSRVLTRQSLVSNIGMYALTISAVTVTD